MSASLPPVPTFDSTSNVVEPRVLRSRGSLVVFVLSSNADDLDGSQSGTSS